MSYISVVVPVYNAEKTIERCVNSITGQSFEDLDIILVDDGSGDTSGALCDELASKDRRIRVFHKENGGVSSARNCGIDNAAAELLIFVDSDDYLPINYCEELMDAYEYYGKDVFVWSAVKISSPNNRVKGETINYSEEKYSSLKREDVLKLSAKYLLNSPVNKLYSTEVIKRYSICMDEKLKIAEDLLFNLQYLDALGNCKIVVLNYMHYNYVRTGQESLDHGYRENYYTIHKKVLQRLWEYCMQWNVPDEDIELYYFRYWEYMQSALSNIDLAGKRLNEWHKFLEKGRIIRDKQFQKSVDYMKTKMGRGNHLVLKSRLYSLVWLYERIRH